MDVKDKFYTLLNYILLQVSFHVWCHESKLSKQANQPTTTKKRELNKIKSN